MLSNPSAFFIRNLILLLIVLCLPGTAAAQEATPTLIELPREAFVPNGFVVFGRAPTAREAGILDSVVYRPIQETSGTIAGLIAVF